jgi:apolipoprotein N-acyltransferase
MFGKITSKNERIYVIIVVALSIGLFSISRTVWWLYGMAFLLFLSAFIFRDRPKTKKEVMINLVGFVALCFIFFWIGEYIINL